MDSIVWRTLTALPSSCNTINTDTVPHHMKAPTRQGTDWKHDGSITMQMMTGSWLIV